MLTFFRKIRRRLLARTLSDTATNSFARSGSARKYIFYAIGEVLLVMLGILLALQVNNWNENVKLKKTEMNLLEGFVKEMKHNIDLLGESLIRHRSHDSISINIINNWDLLSDHDKIISVDGTRRYWTTDLISGVVKAIISEHGLSIISDNPLRQFISSWEDQKNDFYENEEVEADLMHNRFYPLLSEYVSLQQILSYKEVDANERQNIMDESRLMEDLSALVKTKKFENLLLERRFNRRQCILEIEALKEQMNDAILLAQRVLNGS